jgi:hypothetical protein
MAATKDELQQRLSNLEAAIAPLQSAADRAAAAEAEAFTARDNAAKLYPVASLLTATIAAKNLAAKNPNDAAAQAAAASAQAAFTTAKAAYLPFSEAAADATAETIRVRGPLVDAEMQAGEIEQQIAILDGNAPAEEQAKADALAAEAEDPTSTIKSPDAINESETDLDTEEKYADPNNTPAADDYDPSSESDEMPDVGTRDTESDEEVSDEDRLALMNANEDRFYGRTPKTDNGKEIPKGAETGQRGGVSAEWAGAKDLRVYLRVPSSYLIGPAAGPSGILKEHGGVLFPYTPTVSYDSQAQYGAVNPVHSNYTQYFYKNSQISTIAVTGKFTVQNEKEGAIWLGIIHLLRALTKMRWGTDANAGAPPPVCRLEGYGDFMLRNVPVVITSFKFDLPDNVDYIAVNGQYKSSLVPSISSINLTLAPMYSRREIQDFSVDKWLGGSLRGEGYL